MGKLSRQANFERLATNLFAFFIETESNVSTRSKLTPGQFQQKLEDFRYVTKGGKEEEDDEINPAEIDKFSDDESP